MKHTTPRTTARPRAPRVLAGICVAATLLVASAIPGCVIGAFVGGVAESAYQAGSTRMPVEYDGLVGKSYAVIVSADRAIEAENPGVVEQLTQRINRLIAENAGASGTIPTATLLGVLYNNPSWRAVSRGQLGEELGVERLVVVELNEYRLHEPGNQYIWDGMARAIVQVYEIDSSVPDEPLFERGISVTYPDSTGILREQLTQPFVTSVLSQRLSDRAAWLFYEHEEPNAIEY